MATLTIRNLSESARQALKVKAARNGRSMEAEVRDILESAAGSEPGFIVSWLDAARQARGADLPLPVRARARDVDLS